VSFTYIIYRDGIHANTQLQTRRTGLVTGFITGNLLQLEQLYTENISASVFFAGKNNMPFWSIGV